MTVSRFVAWTLLTASGFALLTAAASAQDAPLPQRPNAAVILIGSLKDSRGIAKADLPKAREAFAAFAKYFADIVTNPTVYKAMQDPKLGATGPTIPTIDWNPETNGILRDMERFILVPSPFVKTTNPDTGLTVLKVTVDNADYIREMGAALDAALKPLVEGTNPEPIVRLNAMRVLAVACKSGAAAHYPTVTALLKNANTPTQIKYYALQAAGNLLAAYDVNEYKIRKHSHGPKEVGELVAAVQECVVNPNAIVAGIPGGKIADATPEQINVTSFVRRQAIRALAEVRSVSLPGPDGQMLYPAYTLARVCLSDASLGIPSTPADCAEAIIGLCNMAPVYMGNQVKNFNPDAAVEAIATGLLTFAKLRAGNPADRSLPWRGYSARLGYALRAWKPLFDPTFDPTASDPNNPDKPGTYTDRDVPASVNELIKRTQIDILGPIDKVGLDGKPDLTATVDLEDLRRFLSQLHASPKRDPLLFRGVLATTIVVAGMK